MSTKEKMQKCATCGEEIAKSAKVCPHCGGKIKKPFYKRPGLIVLAIIIVVCIISCSKGTDTNVESDVIVDSTNTQTNVEVNQEPEQIEYISYEVSTLVDDLQSNAMKAEQTYLNAYVELTGKLSVIDSDGKYITLDPTNNDFSFINVRCNIKNEEQKSKVIEMLKGDIVTLRGKIKSIGEVLGYELDIHSID